MNRRALRSNTRQNTQIPKKKYNNNNKSMVSAQRKAQSAHQNTVSRRNLLRMGSGFDTAVTHAGLVMDKEAGQVALGDFGIRLPVSLRQCCSIHLSRTIYNLRVDSIDKSNKITVSGQNYIMSKYEYNKQAKCCTKRPQNFLEFFRC